MDRSRQQFLPTADSATKSLFYSTRMLRNVFISKFSLQLPWTYDTWENIFWTDLWPKQNINPIMLSGLLCAFGQWEAPRTPSEVGILTAGPRGRAHPLGIHSQESLWSGISTFSSLKYISSIYPAHQKQPKMTVMLQTWKPCRCLNPPRSLF